MPDLFSELERIKDRLKVDRSKGVVAVGQPAEQVSGTADVAAKPTPGCQGPLLQLSVASFPANTFSAVDARRKSPSHAARRQVAQRHGAPTEISQTPGGDGAKASQRTALPPVKSSVRQQVLGQKAPAKPAPKVAVPALSPVNTKLVSSKRFEPVSPLFRSLPRGPLTRQALFRQPDAWISAGGRTQLSHVRQVGAVDVVIGLDFGTSYTKAAVGFRDKIFPVTWDGVSRCKPNYLLPSEYTQLSDGSLFIGQHPSARPDEVCTDLKLPFINPADSSTGIGRASIFIALVLRYIRAWVFRHHGAKLGRAQLRWQLNIGAPSDGLENTCLLQAYRRLAATAWQRSFEANPLRLAGPEEGLWNELDELEDLVAFEVLPEFVAQMAGYMQSPQRQRGLHALIDVGGGTLDVVTFIVHRVEGEDAFPFLVPQVHPLGTHGLIQNRLAGLEAVPSVHAVDELAPIATASAFAQMTGLAVTHITLRDALFKNELLRVIKGVFDTTKSRRYRLSDAWRTGVRTFFTGGGSRFALYRDVVATAEVPSAQGLLLMPLPPHKNLDGFSGDTNEYQRISVACGLAQDAFTLGKIVPASEVADDHAVAANPWVTRTDREELYPK